MNLTLLTTAIAAAVAGAAGFGLAWQLQAGNISELNLEHANERISIQRTARATIERNMSQNATAQTDSAKRSVRVRVDSDGSRNAGNGLRLTSTATVRASEDFTDACRAIVAAYDSVVAASSDFIQDVARDADQCHSDIQLMQDAWPQNPVP